VHNAADGKRLNVDPAMLRGHLARLLHELRLDDEASTEAKASESRQKSIIKPDVLPGSTQLVERLGSVRP
jgi:hypothetical protein